MFVMNCRSRKINNIKLFCLLFFLFVDPCLFGNRLNARDSLDFKNWEDSARYYKKKGIDYYWNGNYDDCEEFLLKSLKIHEKNRTTDYLQLVVAYNNLGSILLEKWKFEDAIKYYENAEKMLKKSGAFDSTDFAVIWANMGLVYTKLGELKKAEIYQKMALNQLSKPIDVSGKISMMYLYNTLAFTSGKLKKNDETIGYYNEAVKIASKINKKFLWVIFGNMAIFYQNNKDLIASDFYYKKAIDEYVQDNIDNKYKLSNLYSNYAELCIEIGDFDMAIDISNKAFGLIKNGNFEKNPLTSRIYRIFGDCYKACGNYLLSLNYYQKSIISLIENYADSSVYSIPNVDKVISNTYMLQTLKSKAAAFDKYFDQTKNADDLEASLNIFQLAIELIDKIRLGYQDQESKLYLAENERKTYTDAIAVALKMWKVTGNEKYKNLAYEFSEKSKASVLLSSLRDAGAKGFGGIPDSLLKAEKDLVRDMAFYHEQIYEEKRKGSPDKTKIELWEKKIFDLNNKYDNLIKEFENNYPEYYSLKYKTSVTGIRQIRRKLDNESTLLEYTLTDSALYIFAIRKDGFNIYEQSIDTSFYHAFDDMLKSVTQIDPTRHNGANYTRYLRSSMLLYNTLIGTCRNKIKGKRLIIIPDDKLAFLPFGALLQQTINREDYVNYKNLDYLLNDFSISYSYSSTMLFEQQYSREKHAEQSLLAIAPMYSGSDFMAFRGRPRNGYRKDLSPIPGAKEEVEYIYNLLKGRLLEDHEATESNFKKYADKYDILHLAMHALVDNDDPMFSKLVFSASDDSLNDGFLNTHEIYNLKLNARMAVLSSCNSGEGLLKKGEGVVSLSRGFSYAGCPSLIMTLWELEDKAGVELMVSFYKYLKMGYPKDIALQKSKIEFIGNNPQMLAHPFYWSAYQCIGDTSPLFYSPYKTAILLIGVLFIILILFFGLRRKYRRRFMP